MENEEWRIWKTLRLCVFALTSRRATSRPFSAWWPMVYCLPRFSALDDDVRHRVFGTRVYTENTDFFQ